MKLDPFLIQYAKLNLKWIKDLSIRGKAIKFRDKHIGVNLCDLGLSDGLLYMAATAQATKENIKWTSSKLKTIALGSVQFGLYSAIKHTTHRHCCFSCSPSL